MTTYPSPPQSFYLSWNDALNIDPTPIVQRRGGGIDARGNAYQINQTLQQQDIKLVVSNYDNYQEIEDFINARDGKPFMFENYLYTIMSHSWRFLSDEVWELSAQMEQVYRP